MIISCNPNGLQLFHFGRVRMGCVFIKCIYGLPIAGWNEMSIDVNGHLDARMTQLFLDVNRTFTIWEQKAGKAIPWIDCLAEPFWFSRCLETFTVIKWKIK
jgi:hypothetical protein